MMGQDENAQSADRAAFARLVAHDHGVLCTLHPDRGVDAVPVVYAVAGQGPDAQDSAGANVNEGVVESASVPGLGVVGVPVDRVKPKASLRLQRERNLEADPRATLLIDHWDPHDWTRLWWVRAELRWVGHLPSDDTRVEQLAARLTERYPPYRDRADGDPPFARVLVFDVVGLTSWSASTDGRDASPHQE